MNIETPSNTSDDNLSASAPSSTTTTTEKLSSSTTIDKHACEIEVTFPTDLQAEQALQILQVDREPTDRVSKSFQLVSEEGAKDANIGGRDTIRKLKV
jgi:hypothetical protein